MEVIIMKATFNQGNKSCVLQWFGINRLSNYQNINLTKIFDEQNCLEMFLKKNKINWIGRSKDFGAYFYVIPFDQKEKIISLFN